MKVALIQTDILWNAPEANVARCTALAREAVSKGADLLIFPEMFTCGFSKPTGDLARSCHESGVQFLRDIAHTSGVYAIGSVPEPFGVTDVYNSAFVTKPDGSLERYRKIHLFSYGAEAKEYSAGTETLTTSIQAVRCSVFICYDLRFPMPFSTLAEKTDLFVVVANWPDSRREHWLTLLRARAIESQAYVAGVNRTGSDPELRYSGDSVMFAPDGTQMNEVTEEERVIVVDIDPGRITEWRNSFPALRDRRPEIYRTLS